MSNDDLMEKIKEIIIHDLGVPEERVIPEVNLRDGLGADSLDIVELTMSFEEEFDIEISDEDMEKLATVQDVFNYINERT